MTSGPDDPQRPAAKKRGRPRNVERPDVARADEAIGRTVWQLLMWGYPGEGSDPEGNVLAVVGPLARHLLSRDGTDKGPGADHLTAEAVRDIYRKWRRAQPSGWISKHVSGAPVPARWMKESRLARRPSQAKSIDHAARVLLANGGRVPEEWKPLMWRRGDRVLTAGERRKYPPVKFLRADPDPEDDKTR